MNKFEQVFSLDLQMSLEDGVPVQWVSCPQGALYSEVPCPVGSRAGPGPGGPAQ